MLRIELSACTLKDMESLYSLAHMLAQYFPQPELCMTGIFELLVNAVEHGNLGIGYTLKTELIRSGCWKEEIERRLSLRENTKKSVYVALTQNSSQCTLEITDQGAGFDWTQYIHRVYEGKAPNGRGLTIVFNSAFDHISFNSKGNGVTCSAEYKHTSKAPRQNIEMVENHPY